MHNKIIKKTVVTPAHVITVTDRPNPKNLKKTWPSPVLDSGDNKAEGKSRVRLSASQTTGFNAIIHMFKHI